MREYIGMCSRLYIFKLLIQKIKGVLLMCLFPIFTFKIQNHHLIFNVFYIFIYLNKSKKKKIRIFFSVPLSIYKHK